LIVSAQPLDVLSLPGVTHIVDAQGLVAKRYDGQDGSTYLLRPDQHVAARWRQFDSHRIAQALARATGQA
jgi:3-(3-hydroxy-phenyl)propionate hydroxylase